MHTSWNLQNWANDTKTEWKKRYHKGKKKDTENDALVVTWIGDNLLFNRLNLSLLWMLLLGSWPRWTTAESRDAAESDFIKHNKLSKQQKRVP